MREHYIDEQEQALVERGRSGNRQAREEIILSLQTWVEHCALSWRSRYGWQSSLPDVAELSQVANLAMLEKLDRALAVERPFAYLQTTASGAIRSAVCKAPQTYSLDLPLCDGSTDTFADQLAAPATAAPAEEQDYALLYQAIETLTDQQRDLVLRRFGLLEHAPESYPTISKSWKNSGKHLYGRIYDQRDRALARLRLALAPIAAAQPLESEVGA